MKLISFEFNDGTWNNSPKCVMINFDTVYGILIDQDGNRYVITAICGGNSRYYISPRFSSLDDAKKHFHRIMEIVDEHDGKTFVYKYPEKSNEEAKLDHIKDLLH